MKRLVAFALGALVLASTLPAWAHEGHDEHRMSLDQALQALKDGNGRFKAGTLTHYDVAGRREELAKGQKPFATILSCSDSRVPPEAVFDQGLGDLFVVRVAGNISTDANIASIEYAAEHLGSHLVVVLGHERCGAVTAAVKGGKPAGHLASLLIPLHPAVVQAKRVAAAKKLDAPNLIEEAIRLNAKDMAQLLRGSKPILAEMAHSGRLKVVAARYDLDTGAVDFLE